MTVFLASKAHSSNVSRRSDPPEIGVSTQSRAATCRKQQQHSFCPSLNAPETCLHALEALTIHLARIDKEFCHYLAHSCAAVQSEEACVSDNSGRLGIEADELSQQQLKPV